SEVRLWEAGRLPRRVGEPLDTRGLPQAPVFSPDGKTLLTLTQASWVRRWETVSGQPLDPWKWLAQPLDGGRLPSGKPAALAWNYQTTLQPGSTATGQPIGPPWVLDGATVERVVLSPDGKTALLRVVNYYQEAKTVLRLWDVATGRPIGQPLPDSAVLEPLALRLGNRVLLTVHNDSQDRQSTVAVWDVATGKNLGEHSYPKYLRTIALSPDEKTYFAMADVARLVETATGQTIATLEPRPTQGIQRAAFSPDG